MSFSEIFVLILLVITLFLFCIFLFKKFYKSKSSIERIEKDLKIYYDDEFKECVEILSNRLLKNEFEKVCLLCSVNFISGIIRNICLFPQ